MFLKITNFTCTNAANPLEAGNTFTYCVFTLSFAVIVGRAVFTGFRNYKEWKISGHSPSQSTVLVCMKNHSSFLKQMAEPNTAYRCHTWVLNMVADSSTPHYHLVPSYSPHLHSYILLNDWRSRGLVGHTGVTLQQGWMTSHTVYRQRAGYSRKHIF